MFLSGYLTSFSVTERTECKRSVVERGTGSRYVSRIVSVVNRVQDVKG